MSVANTASCLDACKKFEGLDIGNDGIIDNYCTWFTFDSVNQGCQLLDGCSNIDTTCSTCISGNVDCDPNYYGEGKLHKLNQNQVNIILSLCIF